MGSSVPPEITTTPAATATPAVAPAVDAPKTDNEFAARFDAKQKAKAAEPSPTVKPEPTKSTHTEPTAKTDSDDDVDDDSDEDIADARNTDDSDDDATLQQRFADALKAEGAEVSLEGLSPEAKVIVEKRLADLQRGFTKATQKARADLGDLHTLKAELAFRDENFLGATVKHLLEHPELQEQLNELFESVTAHPKGLDYHNRELADKRKTAADAVTKAADDARKYAADTEVIERTARVAAAACDVPLTRSMRNEIARERERLGGHITRKEILEVIRADAKEIRSTQRAQRRDESAASVADRVAASKSGLPISPRVGNSPAPTAEVKPKNDKEFAEQMDRKFSQRT